MNPMGIAPPFSKGIFNDPADNLSHLSDWGQKLN
jgi:hypothetical protein